MKREKRLSRVSLKKIVLPIVIAISMMGLSGCITITVDGGGKSAETSEKEDSKNNEDDGLFKTRSSKSFTFNVSTGDAITLEMDTSDGWDLGSSVPLEIYKDDAIVVQGIFLTMDEYIDKIELIKDDKENVKILEESTKDGNEYIFVELPSEDEWDYIIKVEDSDTAVQIAGFESEEIVTEAFERLTISVE